MAASDAIIGYGTTFSVETVAGNGIYVELAEITNLTPPNMSVDDIEVTHMQSPDRTKEFIAGLADPGEMSLEMNFIPGSSSDDLILAWRAAGDTRSCRIDYADNSAVDTFPAYVKSYSSTMGVAEALKASLSLKVAGAVVRA